MTKAQMKEAAIQKAKEALDKKKALEEAKKAAKKAKASGGAVTEQREKAVEALARKQQEREERQKREAQEAYERSPEGRAALKAERDEKQKAHEDFIKRSERYNLKLVKFQNENKIVFRPDGQEYTKEECDAMWSQMSRSERKKEQARLYPESKKMASL